MAVHDVLINTSKQTWINTKYYFHIVIVRVVGMFVPLVSSGLGTQDKFVQQLLNIQIQKTQTLNRI